MMQKAVFDYDNQQKGEISSFNEAKFQILRLHALWTMCHRLSNSGLLEQWKWRLDSVWRELAADARKKDGGKEAWEEITKAITENNPTDKQKESYFYQNYLFKRDIAENKDNKSRLYDLLQDREVFLRCLQDYVGKGAAWKSEDEDDFDQ